MTIIMPLGVIAIILVAFFVTASQNKKIRYLKKKSDSISNNDEYLVNVLNTGDERRTLINEENGRLKVFTDIQIFQLTKEGKLKARISSNMDNIPVNFDFSTIIDPLFSSSIKDVGEKIDSMVAFPFRETRTRVVLDYLDECFGISYGNLNYAPCIAVKYSDIKIHLDRKEIILSGKFEDEGDWRMDIDYNRKRLAIDTSLESLKNKSNFSKYFIDFVD